MHLEIHAVHRRRIEPLPLPLSVLVKEAGDVLGVVGHLPHDVERTSYRRPKECGLGSDSQTVSFSATWRASGERVSSLETRMFRFSPIRS